MNSNTAEETGLGLLSGYRKTGNHYELEYQVDIGCIDWPMVSAVPSS